MKNNSGFTLVEVIIVVAIVAVLASIAYPSYEQHIIKSKRSEAMAALINAAQAMERFRVSNYSYDLPNGLSDVFAIQVPVDGGAKYYDLTVVDTASTYTLTATPVGSMAGKDSALTLTNTGLRTWNGKNCWPEGSNDC
ncbi:type IV pilin protein [Aliikangiella coralliicola]|uniref:Prepilin-type N-terminal cleavage/methylation domain-containing protein n=1 Tax=Aliikangiella coralliicola TaxID=2592383 RepID=A0A545UA95_9GAMM|nr:type IV pilin protein [Aliikangiella coralliicola]TQV86395.1 prepilin-type N-terminal cleavage/methylation domain-containing protein [Aliikangiella coralliicola]